MADNLFNAIYNPDVLSCIANLSNDEVFTPPDVANAILDMLPQELFSNPNTTFLDPACKSGVFLREIAKRLLIGLEKQIPDLQERVDHIFQKQLFGIAITELTGHLSRRSVYCSKQANGKYAITQFNKIDGNIRYKTIEHKFKDGKCLFCGASESEYGKDARGEDLETHAYELIHTTNPEDIFKMKFDVVISNPPYQLSDGGNGASAKPIYQEFVRQAKKLNPRFLTMIIPSRWFSGGKGLDSFREEMFSDSHITRLIDYQNAKDCFPGVSLGGGVCYFLRERDRKDDCEITNIINNKTSIKKRKLNEFPVFVRYNDAIEIIKKVRDLKETCISSFISSRNPFGLATNIRGEQNRSSQNDLELFSSQGNGFLKKDTPIQNEEFVDKYKIMISRVTSEHAGEPDKTGMYKVIAKMQVLNPGQICTDSYVIAYPSNNIIEVQNFYEYLKTKFARFLILQTLSSINLSKEKYGFVPVYSC